MKILIVIPSYKPANVYGGPVRSIAALCESLVTAGNDVAVYTTTANGQDELDVENGREYTIDGVKVRYFSRVTKGHSNLSFGLLRTLMEQGSKFDIIHIQSWWNLVAIPGAMICLMKGIVPIISPRGTLSNYTFASSKNWTKRILHSLVGRRWLNHSVLHVTSERESKEAMQYVDPKNIYIIPNILDLPERNVKSKTEKAIFKLIFLGRIDPAKNLELLLNVLTDDFPVPYQLNIVGEGTKEYTETLKKFSTGNNSIRWVGAKDGEVKLDLLADADLLVLPSHTENFGNVVLEALSQGTPVLLSANVGAKEYVLTHQLGWVVDGDQSKWKEALVAIWKDGSMRDTIRNIAPACIARDFDSKEQVKDYISMYTANQNVGRQ